MSKFEFKPNESKEKGKKKMGSALMSRTPSNYWFSVYRV